MSSVSEASGNKTSLEVPIDGDLKTPEPVLRGSSEAPSEYSYSSSNDRDWLLREIHGRTLNNSSEVGASASLTANAYRLFVDFAPLADIEEHSRLSNQSLMFKKMINGLFIAQPAVRRALRAREDGYRPQVLDIGTGSGLWVVEMAKTFPHADVVGVDLVPAILSKEAPPNCRFEVDDANLGFSHYASTFDVVHVRCVSVGIKDWHALLREMEAALRPGGVLLTFGTAGLQVYDANKQLIEAMNEGEEGFTWSNKLLQIVWGFNVASNPKVGDHPKFTLKWLSEMDVWEDVGTRTYFSPLGPWETDLTPRESDIAELSRHDFHQLAAAFKPMLLMNGMAEEEVETLIANTQGEIKNLRKHQYIKWFASYGVKKST